MRRLRKLPPSFKRFRRMGGVLEFAIFEGSTASEEEVFAGIEELLPGFDAAKLRFLGSRKIKERRFLGEWHDPATGNLIKRGSYTLFDGTELLDPPLKKLDRARIASGASGIPGAGDGGDFAYAFTCPPYGLHARPSEVQAVFDDILEFIMPRSEPVEILDWTSPRLPEVSPYFEPGIDWWGVFLFSLYVPALHRLTIVAGSATD
jgi:hypothetical protein